MWQVTLPYLPNLALLPLLLSTQVPSQKTLALSVRVSPQTIHFRVLEPTLGPCKGLGGGPPSGNSTICHIGLQIFFRITLDI